MYMAGYSKISAPSGIFFKIIGIMSYKYIVIGSAYRWKFIQQILFIHIELFESSVIFRLHVKSVYRGYANLFYYNEQTEELEFISAGQIDPDGNVELVFTHASDYTIVVDARIMSDNAQADNKSDETIPAPKTDDSTSKYAWNNTIIIIIGICIILNVFGAVFYVRKKSGSEEE